MNIDSKKYPLLAQMISAGTKHVYIAWKKAPDGEHYWARAERKNNRWEIGGDYDYRGMVGIWDLTDRKAYMWKNGRLKFSDSLGPNDIRSVLLELKQEQERRSEQGMSVDNLDQINKLIEGL